MPANPDKVRALLFGVAVGDALGVPYEFRSRESIRKEPVTGMTGYGTYKMPPGTFSDDSSLTFCLAEALIEGYDLNIIADNFVKWKEEKFWTPHGDFFDIGISTSRALSRIIQGVSPFESGCTEDGANGNGSLMRISPIAFFLKDKPVNERFEITRQVSSVTHAHIRSVISCFYYVEYEIRLIEGKDKFDIYNHLKTEVTGELVRQDVDPSEISKFDRLLKGNIFELDESKISGSGYVVDTLEASIWCLLTTSSYSEAVLKAVNLGQDTDTTGAVTGGLAGLLYGIGGIPAEWKSQIVRHDDIEDLAIRFADSLK